MASLRFLNCYKKIEMLSEYNIYSASALSL